MVLVLFGCQLLDNGSERLNLFISANSAVSGCKEKRRFTLSLGDSSSKLYSKDNTGGPKNNTFFRNYQILLFLAIKFSKLRVVLSPPILRKIMMTIHCIVELGLAECDNRLFSSPSLRLGKRQF